MLNWWSISMLFLCLTSSVLAQASPSCLKDWIYFAKSNKCLKLFGSGNDGVSRTNWSKAEEYCNQFHRGHLAALKSEEEITFVVEMMRASGYDDGDDSRIFIGLFFSKASGWAHPDGSDVTYFRWYAGGADQREDGRYPSGVLVTRGGSTGYMFVNERGNNWLGPFICQSTPTTEGRK